MPVQVSAQKPWSQAKKKLRLSRLLSLTDGCCLDGIEVARRNWEEPQSQACHLTTQEQVQEASLTWSMSRTLSAVGTPRERWEDQEFKANLSYILSPVSTEGDC